MTAHLRSPRSCFFLCMLLSLLAALGCGRPDPGRSSATVQRDDRTVVPVDLGRGSVYFVDELRQIAQLHDEASAMLARRSESENPVDRLGAVAARADMARYAASMQRIVQAVRGHPDYPKVEDDVESRLSKYTGFLERWGR